MVKILACCLDFSSYRPFGCCLFHPRYISGPLCGLRASPTNFSSRHALFLYFSSPLACFNYLRQTKIFNRHLRYRSSFQSCRQFNLDSTLWLLGRSRRYRGLRSTDIITFDLSHQTQKMTGIILSLLTSIFESLKDVTAKRSLKNVDEYATAWSLRVFALPFLLPLLLFIEIPKIQSQFWMALVIGGALNIITTILYMRAIKISDLSLIAPMITFTPFF